MANTTDINTFRKLVDRTITEYNDDAIRTLSPYAFSNCSLLENVYLPNLSEIGDYAFYECASITEINLPKITRIGKYAFYNCTSLKELYLPCPNVIFSSFISGCTSLERLYIGIEKTSVVYVYDGSSVRSPSDYLMIYVPDNLVDSYKASSSWIKVADIILPYSSSPDA